ncbi:carboxypeptidase-like regulatory domain-containing protein [Porifericola rhodea]|uniref:carboxypeptidase-like regulatory domain-containing protein n=1 Tax=Porifericola rhodea TaxID=930972 RepID=UPI0026668438|nr:carboxypeptidase-like regulatory domain-containing protein [Porifericola rhodea]WKN32904.1 carboxypeptidase-like regulatory domain-containing protein [Porifericola rhodea]
MRKILPGICLFWIVYLPLCAQSIEEIRWTGSYSNTKLPTIFEAIEAQYPVRFFYRQEWLEDIVFTGTFSQEPLPQLMQKLLQGTELTYKPYQGPYIILLHKNPNTLNHGRGREGEDNLIVIGDSLSNQGQTSATVSGYIRDGATGQGVTGATIFALPLEKGISTNINGYFSLSLPIGNHRLQVNSLGFEEESRNIKVISDGSLSVDLYEETARLEEITITERAEDYNVSSAQMSATRMDIQKVKKMPAFLGEVDLINSIELLPGVSVAGEGSAGFNVRGGDVGQNLILLDGISIFNPSHLFGFFSAFNADLLSDATLYKGGIPARYGGRLASVLDVSVKEGNLRQIKGSGGIGLVASRLSLEVPLVEEKSALIIGGRASYSDWILNRVDDMDLRQSEASFYDANLKWTYRLNEAHKIGLTGYISNDDFTYTRNTSYGYQNKGAAFNWDFLISQDWLSSLTLSHSRFSYEVGDLQDSTRASLLQAGFDISEGRWNVTRFWGERHQVDAGLSLSYYSFEPGEQQPYGDFSLLTPETLAEEQAWEMAVYLSDEFTITPALSLNIGLRYNQYRALGPADVTIYQNGNPSGSGRVVDTVSYASGETIAQYQGLEPRLALKYNLDARSSIKLSYNRMRQNMHLISNATSITPTDIWKLSNKYVQPQIGDQYAIGYFRNAIGNVIESSLEVYYKDIHQLVEYKDGAEILMNDQLETELLTGIGRAYGAELYVAKNLGRLTGWLSYTYSRSLRKVDGQYPDERVNQGSWYPSNFDKPHDFTVVGNYQFTRRLRMGFNFTYSTGRPVSLPEGTYKVGNQDIAHFSARNQYRVADYHRLDISFSVDGNLKKKKKWDSSWTFAIYNLYGRNNPYSIFFRNNAGGSLTAYQLAILGRPFPSVTYNFKF